MTLEEKVGQMLCFAFNGTEYSKQVDTIINDFNAGGVIYFASNITSPAQAAALNKKIQETAKIPLFTCIDQEGGSVLRIMDGIVPFPGAMALSATDKNIEDLCYHVGKDLKSLGFNLNHAPVADVNSNPANPVINSRAYSDDPERVAKYVCEAFKGFQRAKVLPTIKHFPGHGNTSQDSHLLMPSLNTTKEEIKQNELIPFQRAFDEGVDGVMVSHVLYTAYDEKNPATLSKPIMTDLLQKEMGFKGLIVTDSLTMGAIVENYTTDEVIRLCVGAGVDMMIFCGPAKLEDQAYIYNKFVEMVKNNEISMERIDHSVKKILELKEKYCYGEISTDNLADEKATQDAIKLSEESITQVLSNGILPLKETDKVLVISTQIKVICLVDNENSGYRTINEYLHKDEFVIDSTLSNFDEIISKAKNYDKIIFATYNVKKNDFQTKVFNALDKEKTVVVSLRSPYDIVNLEGIKNYVCAYEATPLAFNSVSKCLTGKIKFNGKAPIKF